MHHRGGKGVSGVKINWQNAFSGGENASIDIIRQGKIEFQSNPTFTRAFCGVMKNFAPLRTNPVKCFRIE
jgi:hypothetical protein